MASTFVVDASPPSAHGVIAKSGPYCALATMRPLPSGASATTEPRAFGTA